MTSSKTRLASLDGCRRNYRPVFQAIVVTVVCFSCGTFGLSPTDTYAGASRRNVFKTVAAVVPSVVLGQQAALAIEESAFPRTVCVTGANGYIGLHVVDQLLRAGCNVRAAVRKTTDEKTKWLSKVAADCDATNKLSFVPVDLMNVQSMKDAASGCDAIVHLASPFQIEGVKDAKNTILDPAVVGACNVVEVAKQDSRIQRVVTCGSIFGVVGSAREQGFDHLYTASDVNHFSTLNGNAYAFSKKEAQEKSGEMAEAYGVDLVTLNVGQVIGPALSPDQNSPAWEPIILLASPPVKGPVLSAYIPGFVDVRDVAAAHVAALRLPSSPHARRYIVAAQQESPTFADLAALLAEILPERNLPGQVETFAPSTQKFILDGIALTDKSLGQLLQGLQTEKGKTLLVDVEPMRRDLLPSPRSTKETLADFVANQQGYGHKV